MSPEPGTSFQPAIQQNGLDGTVPQVSGFALASPSGPIMGNPVSMALAYSTPARETKTLGGFNIARLYSFVPNYSGGTQPLSTWLVEHDLSGMGMHYASFGLWQYYGNYSSGYVSGNSLYWGAYAFGSATDATEAAAMASKHYVGLAGDLSSYPQYQGVSSEYGSADVVYDATTQTVTVTVQATNTNGIQFQTQLGGFSSFVDNDAPLSASTPITCTAPVVAGAFQCGTATSGGAISGRVYGPYGDEVAGTYSSYWFVAPIQQAPYSGAFQGAIGGFAAKATTVSHASSVVRRNAR
jgi:hypothetical protein